MSDTKKEEAKIPALFTPLTIRGITLKNRISVSPMCQYSSEDGFMNEHHLKHLGRFAVGGAGLVIAEATGVLANGRISPACAGLWKDEHMKQQKVVVDYIHKNGAYAGIQLAHAGRKGSTMADNIPGHPALADKHEGGWPDDVWAPSAVMFAEGFAKPIAMTKKQIEEVTAAFVAAAIRADKIGYDVIELHGAHGYLMSEFLSPLANKRTDEYGGNLENRMRLCIEVCTAVRKVWPEKKPLFLRLSCSDWVPGGITIEESVQVARAAAKVGVDLVDCSSGGNAADMSGYIKVGPGYQVPFSEKIRAENKGLLTAAVGMITTPKQADEIVKKGQADLVMLAREHLRNPNFGLTAAKELGVDLEAVLKAQAKAATTASATSSSSDKKDDSSTTKPTKEAEDPKA